MKHHVIKQNIDGSISYFFIISANFFFNVHMQKSVYRYKYIFPHEEYIIMDFAL